MRSIWHSTAKPGIYMMEEGKAGIYGGNVEMLDGSEEEDEAELMDDGGRCFQGSAPEGL